MVTPVRLLSGLTVGKGFGGSMARPDLEFSYQVTPWCPGGELGAADGYASWVGSVAALICC